MPATIHSDRHDALVELIVAQRKLAKLSQAAVAKRLGRYQSFIADIERGQRRLDVIEFLDLATAIGLDVPSTLATVSQVSESSRKRLRASRKTAGERGQQRDQKGTAVSKPRTWPR